MMQEREWVGVMFWRKAMQFSIYAEGLILDEYGELFYLGVIGEKVEYMCIDVGKQVVVDVGICVSCFSECFVLLGEQFMN